MNSSHSAIETPAATSMPVAESADLPAIIGAELSRPLSGLGEVLAEIKRTRTISRHQLKAMEAALAHASRIAHQSQQISRLAGGRLRQSHERLGLHEMLADILKSQAAKFKVAGLEVRQHIKPVEVIVDPGLLSSLIEVAVDWAVGQGQRIQVSLDIKNWPEHGVLILKSTQQIAGGGADAVRADPDTLDWHLLQHIAHVMGVTVERIVAADHSLVLVEFPRTVRQLEGLTAIEVDMGGDAQMSALSEGKPLAGHRVLLVTSDTRIKAEIKDICGLMGLVMDSTPTTAQAVRFCELDKPHMIIIDERLRDHHFEELRHDLKRSDVNFPVVEIASASNTFEMSNWMGDSISRISRDVLKAQLPSILVMELAKVTGGL
jgi:hypothetical protein